MFVTRVRATLSLSRIGDCLCFSLVLAVSVSPGFDALSLY
jgi:hypothetical protein